MADIEIPDLVAVIVEDARTRVEVLVEDTRARLETEARALGNDIAERLSELGSAIQASLIAVAVIMVAAVLLGLAVAATLYAIGIPLVGALWIVTGAALTAVGLLLRSVVVLRRTVRGLGDRREPLTRGRVMKGCRGLGRIDREVPLLAESGGARLRRDDITPALVGRGLIGPALNEHWA